MNTNRQSGTDGKFPAHYRQSPQRIQHSLRACVLAQSPKVSTGVYISFIFLDTSPCVRGTQLSALSLEKKPRYHHLAATARSQLQEQTAFFPTETITCVTL